MADFKKAHALTSDFEGGYANNPLDNGGETYRGIARKFNPNWKGWASIDAIKRTYGAKASTINAYAKKDAVLQAQVDQLYKSNYWDPLKLDQIKSQSIANALFDISVNMGYKVASRMLQEALNLCNKNQISYPDIAVDGIVGNITISMLNVRAGEAAVHNTINLLKGEKYIEIMRANKSQEAFWPSWIRRVILN